MPEYDLTDFLSEEELDTEPLSELIAEDDRTREELIEDARYSEGAEIFFDVKSLFTTLQMVNTNYHQLCKKRNEFLNKEDNYWIRADIQDFFSEYLRRLHNYTTSIHTLISHTYTFLDRYEEKSQELKSKYFDEIKSRDLETKVNLLKQLRHYTQKYWVPPLSAEISGGMSEGEDPDRRLVLDKQDLLDWDGWDSDVEPFLQSLDDEIEITELAINYQSELNDFYEWFRTLVTSVFYEDIIQFVTADLILKDNTGIE
jgi:hypothetical protein